MGSILKKWISFFIITCIFMGTALGSFFIYLVQGEFPYEVFTTGLTVAVILTIIEGIE